MKKKQFLLDNYVVMNQCASSNGYFHQLSDVCGYPTFSSRSVVKENSKQIHPNHVQPLQIGLSNPLTCEIWLAILRSFIAMKRKSSVFKNFKICSEDRGIRLCKLQICWCENELKFKRNHKLLISNKKCFPKMFFTYFILHFL